MKFLLCHKNVQICGECIIMFRGMHYFCEVLNLTGIINCVQEDLTQLEDFLLDAVRGPRGFVGDACEYIIKSGGKRLRPALFIVTARCGENFSLKNVLPLAAALELIHTASLVHDDVIDAAALRRGVPTAHAKWGRQVSILTGDYIFAAAFRLVAEGNYGDFVCRKLAKLVEDLSVGEIIETQTAYTASADFDDYYNRIRKKTADFLEICCELGGAEAKLNPQDAQGLATYGHSIGMAFQIIDDVLDITESQEQIGKPAGNDIRQGITTLPVIRAMEVSLDRDELTAILKNPQMSDADAARALAIVRESDGADFARAKAEDFVERAKHALPDNLPPSIRNALTEAADFIVKRDF